MYEYKHTHYFICFVILKSVPVVKKLSYALTGVAQWLGRHHGN